LSIKKDLYGHGWGTPSHRDLSNAIEGLKTNRRTLQHWVQLDLDIDAKIDSKETKMKQVKDWDPVQYRIQLQLWRGQLSNKHANLVWQGGRALGIGPCPAPPGRAHVKQNQRYVTKVWLRAMYIQSEFHLAGAEAIGAGENPMQRNSFWGRFPAIDDALATIAGYKATLGEILLYPAEEKKYNDE